MILWFFFYFRARFRMWVMNCNVLVHSITFELVVLESPNLMLRCIYGICNLGLIFEGQRSRSPEVKRSKTLIGHISKTTGPIHSKQKPKCTASKGLSSYSRLARIRHLVMAATRKRGCFVDSLGGSGPARFICPVTF